MAKEICISSTPHETRLAILEDDQLAEIYYERENEYTLAGSVYKGRVTRVLPGMQSAFVDVGLERDAFLYVTDFLEEQEEDTEEFERPATPAAIPAGANPAKTTNPAKPAPAGISAPAPRAAHRNTLPNLATLRSPLRKPRAAPTQSAVRIAIRAVTRNREAPAAGTAAVDGASAVAAIAPATPRNRVPILVPILVRSSVPTLAPRPATIRAHSNPLQLSKRLSPRNP